MAKKHKFGWRKKIEEYFCSAIIPKAIRAPELARALARGFNQSEDNAYAAVYGGLRAGWLKRDKEGLVSLADAFFASAPTSGVSSTTANLSEALEKAEILSKKLSELQKEKSEMIGVALEKAKMEKQLKIVNLIVTGKSSEAISELLSPLSFAFNLDVRFGDDESRKAASRELFQNLKDNLVEVLKSAELGEEKASAIQK